MKGPRLFIPLEFAEHLVVQLHDAAKETGWESLLRDAEDIRAMIEEQFPEPQTSNKM